MKKYEVEIKGTVPLLCHRFTEEAQKKIESKTKKQEVEDENPADYLYLDANGKACINTEWIYEGLVKRASNFKIGAGRVRKTYKEIVKGVLGISPTYAVISPQRWVVDVRSVVNPNTKMRNIRKRPMFPEWSASFTISVLSDSLPAEVLKAMLDELGREGGIGDYRPRFGRFIVTKFKEVGVIE